jgi:hypothetical protein
MNRRVRLLITSVLAAVAVGLITAVTVIAGAKPNMGSVDTDIVAMNASTDTQAQIVIQYYDNDGNVVATRNETLDPLLAAVYSADTSGLGDGFQGVAILSSNTELAVVTEVNYSGGSATDGVRKDQYAGVGALSDKLYFPNVVYDTAGTTGVQNTILYVQNGTGSDATIYISWINTDGNQDFTFSEVVPAYGAVVYDTSQGDASPSDTIPDLTTTAIWASNDFWTGGVVVTSTAEALAGAAQVGWRQYASSYNAVTSGGETVVFPAVSRRVYDIVGDGGCTSGSARWADLTVLGIMNLEDASNTVTVTLRDAFGLAPDMVLTRTLPAGSAWRIHTRWGREDWSQPTACQGMQALDRYPTNSKLAEWVGSAIVEAESGKEVAATANTVRKDTNLSHIYEGFVPSAGATEVSAPAVYRHTTGVRTSRYWSLVRIQNMSSSTATVYAHFYTRAGAEVLSYDGLEVGPNGAVDQNIKYDCFGDGTTGCPSYVTGTGMGDSFDGSAYFTSTQPIAITFETLWLDTGLGSYDAPGSTP